MLTVLTWFWAQPHCRTQYNARHVNIWADMIRRNLTLPHRIACVTDIPEGIDPAIEIIRPPGDFAGLHTSRWPREKPSCYRRIAMFRRDAADLFGERFVQIDLDTVVGGNLDSLFDVPDDLVLFRGTSEKRPYNGSMTLMTAGCRPHVYDEFTFEEAEVASRLYVGSDQAWMMHKLGPGEKTWGPEHGVHWFGSSYQKAPPPADELRLLFFPGRIKPWSMPYRDDWVSHNYRDAARFDPSRAQPQTGPRVVGKPQRSFRSTVRRSIGPRRV